MWVNFTAFLTEGNFGRCLFYWIILQVQFSSHAALGGNPESGWECQRVDRVGESL